MTAGMGLERAAAFFIAGAALLVLVPAAADPPPAPTVPVAPPAALAPLAPAGAAPLPLERRSPVAMSGGIAATSIGSILIVGGALAGVLQAACTGECNHTPVIVGLLASAGRSSRSNPPHPLRLQDGPHRLRHGRARAAEAVAVVGRRPRQQGLGHSVLIERGWGRGPKPPPRA